MMQDSEPFEPIDTSDWGVRPPRPRVFIVDQWLASGSGALLAGEGGTGKSLLGQLMVSCVALGVPFLGYETRSTSAAYITCEDDENELHHRQTAINVMLGVTMADYGDFLTLVSLKGRLNNELGRFGVEDGLKVSPTFRQIRDLACPLTVLDNASHFFPGNENVRHDVAAFCNLLDRLAMSLKGSVLLLAHTPKTGAEFSGSTGWDAHVRQRLYLSHAEEVGGVLDEDERTLKRSKANYARRGERVTFRWHKGAFYLPDQIPADQREEMALNARAASENIAFMACLAKSTDSKRAVSHNPGSNYAPKVFANMIEGKGFNEKAFKAAMERLLSLGKIELDQPLWRGPNRVMKQGIKASEKCTDPPAPTPCTDLHETRTNAARFNPPYTTYIEGQALGRPALYDEGQEAAE